MISPFQNLRPEENLLIDLCRLSFNDEQKRITEEQVAAVSDWDYFIKLANEHGVVSIVFYILEQLGLISNIPVDAQATLQKLHLKSLARNTFLIEKFIELTKSLDHIGIESVALKGIALEPAVYGNKGLRQMSDIDIYIEDKNECLRAWEHLKNSGYISKPLKSALYNKLLLDYGKHLPDLSKDGISFDLHYSLFDIDQDVTTISISTNKLNLEIPDYDIHFLYLLKHLNDHELVGGSQLRLYLDLVQILTTTDIDATSNRMIDLAEKLGLKTILFEKLHLLHQIWSIPIDEDILNRLTEDQKKKVTNTFLIFLRDPKGQTGINKGARYRKIIRNIPGLRKKFIFLLGDIFPSLSFMQSRYNTRTRAGACFYYPVRFGKLLLLFIR